MSAPSPQTPPPGGMEGLVDYINRHILSTDVSFLHRDGVAMTVCLLALLATGVIIIRRQRRRNTRERPHGLYNLLEVLVVFVRDQIAVPALGPEAGAKMTPLLCTYLSAIFFMNAAGQIPLLASPTGNISICASLALTSLTLIIAAAMHTGPSGLLRLVIIESPSRVMQLLMAPLELVTLCSRIFSLMIRLFANMLSGHIIVYSILGITVVYKQVFLYIAPFTLLFAACFALFDLAIAALQAYIFTLLTATFVGLALNPEH